MVNEQTPQSETNTPTDDSTRRCEHCQEPLVADEAGSWQCPHCSEKGKLLWILGIALLFFCFVVLPMMIQLLGTPPPTR